MFAAPVEAETEIWPGLSNMNEESFCYFGSTPVSDHACTGLSGNTVSFSNTVEALALSGIGGKSYLMLFRAIVACLLLGNLTFVPKHDGADESVLASAMEMHELQH